MLGYRIFWKHKDFKTDSKGPILRHLEKKMPKTKTKTDELYTKAEAAEICEKFQKTGKKYKSETTKGKTKYLPVVTHWIREALV